MIKVIDKTESIYGTMVIVDTDIKGSLDAKQLSNKRVLLGEIARDTAQAVIVSIDDEVAYKRERRFFTRKYSSTKTTETNVDKLEETLKYDALPQYVRYHITKAKYESYKPGCKHDDIIAVFLYNADTKKAIKEYVNDADNKKDSNYNVIEMMFKEL